MLSIKQVLLIWICSLISFSVYSLCVFFLTEEYSAAFWVSYVFTAVAFIFHSIAAFRMIKKKRSNFRGFLRLPLFMCSSVYLDLQLFVGMIFMIIPFSICFATIIEAALMISFVIAGICIEK